MFESLDSSNQSQKDILQKNNNFFIFSKKILTTKYSKFEYSYSLFCTNNLIFNEKCRLVARFKDYLVLDDSTEFLRRFYFKKELNSRLKKIYNFYESYCKIFPNYMILPESKFLYRNIRKKQKMIDAFNEIKKEEEENRKHLKLGLSDDNKKNANVVFTKKIQDSIERYHPSISNILSNTFMSEISNNLNKEFEYNNNEKSIITLSLNSQRQTNLNEINSNNIKDVNVFDTYFSPNNKSFTEKNFNDNIYNSQNSIFKIVQILNNNNTINNQEHILNTDGNDNTKLNINKQGKKELKNNIKNIRKKFSNNSNTNNKTNIKKNTNNNINMNTINVESKHNKIKNILNNSNNKKKKNEINVNTKKKFISHKQNISVPLAAKLLNTNDNNINNNINNIIGQDDNTIKIINNINNIIINENKHQSIKNGMIININNNYFQLKDSKQLQNNLKKRIKSKENQIKEKPKEVQKSKNKNKENELNKYKIFQEKRTYTTYNTHANKKENKKILSNNIKSPSNKKDKFINPKTQKKYISSKKYILPINDNNQNSNNLYKNTNIQSSKQQFKELSTHPNEENQKNIKKSINKKNNNNHNIVIKESNATISTSYNNEINRKFNSTNQNLKEIPKFEGVGSIDNKKISINRKIVNNYLTSTQKKKTYQGRFPIHEKSISNTFSNKNFPENNNKDKIEFINIGNTVENKNNPIKFKLYKKNILQNNSNINSLQIKNKNEFLSSFNSPKERMYRTNIGLDLINMDENIVKYQKKSLKRILNIKTKANSEVELIKDINKNHNILNTITNKSFKNDKIMKLKKNIDENNKDDKTNIDKFESNKYFKKLNVKEMKEEYHKLLRKNKFNHGSYDIANRIPLSRKFRGLSNILRNFNSSINNTFNLNTNKRNPLLKKNVLIPSERLQNSLNEYINTPIKNTLNEKKEKSTIEVTKIKTKLKMIGKGNKNINIDSNNKKMKLIKK